MTQAQMLKLSTLERNTISSSVEREPCLYMVPFEKPEGWDYYVDHYLRSVDQALETYGRQQYAGRILARYLHFLRQFPYQMAFSNSNTLFKPSLIASLTVGLASGNGFLQAPPRKSNPDCGATWMSNAALIPKKPYDDSQYWNCECNAKDSYSPHH